MLYKIKTSIFPMPGNIIILIIMLASSLMAHAGVYKNGTSDSFNGIADNGFELIAVGDLGMVYTKSLTNGALWVENNTGITSRLLDVASAASYEDIVVGELGVILTRRSGNTYWSRENTNTLGTLRKALVDPNNGTNIVIGDNGLILLYDKTTNSWNPQVSDTTDNLTAIVVNEDSSLYVVLGESGTIITSPDAVSWTVQDGVTNYASSDALYYITTTGEGRYLSVGRYTVYESSDGINWNFLKSLTQTGAQNSFLNRISYSAATSTLRVVGDNGLNLTSTDDGANWTGAYGRLTISAPLNLQDSIYTATYNQTTVGSVSGINGNGQINDIYFNSVTGLYVAVGNRSLIITSTDGKSWSNSNFLPSIPEDIISVTFDGGKYAALTLKGNILTSTNGIDWVSGSWITGSIALTLRDMALDSTGNVYVAITDVEAYTRSDDGTVQGTSVQTSLNSVIYNEDDSQFVAVGDNKILTSPDGLVWTSRSTGGAQGEFRRLNDVFYNPVDGLYVAVGTSANGHLIMTSPDAVTWTAGTIEDMTYLRTLELFGVTYDADANAGSGQYVAVGDEIVVVSQDAVEWTVVNDASAVKGGYIYNQPGATTRFKSVVYDNKNKQYVAVGGSSISVFTPQIITPVFTTGSPVVRIESTSLYMTITPDLALLNVRDYTGRKIYPKLISTDPDSRPYVMGPYTLSWKATDNSGNTALFDQSVIIEDTTAPVLTLNGPALVSLEAGDAYIDQGATATDIVDSYVDVVVAGTFVDTNSVGDFSITYNAMDVAGNTATEVVRTISITDTVAPTISISDVSVYTAGVLTSVALGQPVISDVTSITLTNDAPANGFPTGDTIVTWTVKDAAGNQAAATQTVTVIADNKKPVITLSGASVVTVLYGAAYTDSGANVSDDVDSNVEIVTVNPVNTNKVGSYTVTYNATDYTGNMAVEVTRTVNVVDLQAPVITLSGSAAMRLETGTQFTDPGASVTDNVDENLVIIVTGSVNPSVAGLYTITYSATDTASNTTRVTRMVDVFTPADTEPPVIIAPAPLVITSLDGNGIENSDSRIQAFLGGAGATDNVGVVVIGPGPTPGTFPVGITNVVFSAYDAAGNRSTAISSVTIIVPDTTAPVITVQNSISLSSTDGNGISINNNEVQAYLNSVQVFDNSGSFTLSNSVLPDTLPVGETSVTFTAVDQAGNQTDVIATIIVVDNSPPATSAPAANSGGGGGGGSTGWFIFLVTGLVFLARRFKVLN